MSLQKAPHLLVERLQGGLQVLELPVVGRPGLGQVRQRFFVLLLFAHGAVSLERLCRWIGSAGGQCPLRRYERPDAVLSILAKLMNLLVILVLWPKGQHAGSVMYYRTESLIRKSARGNYGCAAGRFCRAIKKAASQRPPVSAGSDGRCLVKLGFDPSLGRHQDNLDAAVLGPAFSGVIGGHRLEWSVADRCQFLAGDALVTQKADDGRRAGS